MAEEVKPPCEYGCDDGARLVLHRVRKEYHKTRCMCTYTGDKALPLKLILQPEPSGCMLAAVATVVGMTYKEIRQYVDLTQDFTTEGTYTSVIQDLLNDLGYTYQTYGSTSGRLGWAKRPVWPLPPFAVPAICQVLNLPTSGMHAVVLLPDGRVLDPWWGVLQGLHRYERVTEMMPVWKVPAPTPVPLPAAVEAPAAPPDPLPEPPPLRKGRART